MCNYFQIKVYKFTMYCLDENLVFELRGKLLGKHRSDLKKKSYINNSIMNFKFWTNI